VHQPYHQAGSEERLRPLSKAFNAKDLGTINATIRYPLAYIADGEVRMVDASPYDPAELKRSKGWHTTVDAESRLSQCHQRRHT
jgi:hypothetical protein